MKKNFEKIKKTFQKGIDIFSKVCYTIIVPREGNKKKKKVKDRPKNQKGNYNDES